MALADEDDITQTGSGLDSGAWTTGSGESSPETDVPPSSRGSQNNPRESDEHGSPETGAGGTDPESNVPGRSKPASEPAGDTPSHEPNEPSVT
jgi:hypothetical protein